MACDSPRTSLRILPILDSYGKPIEVFHIACDHSCAKVTGVHGDDEVHPRWRLAAFPGICPLFGQIVPYAFLELSPAKSGYEFEHAFHLLPCIFPQKSPFELIVDDGADDKLIAIHQGGSISFGNQAVLFQDAGYHVGVEGVAGHEIALFTLETAVSLRFQLLLEVRPPFLSEIVRLVCPFVEERQGLCVSALQIEVGSILLQVGCA